MPVALCDRAVYRWLRRDGSRLILTRGGQLREALGPAGAYNLVLQRCAQHRADRYALEHDYVYAGLDSSATASAGGKPVLRRQERPLDRRGPEQPEQPEEPEEANPLAAEVAEAMREGRIAGHAARVAAELAGMEFVARGTHMAEVNGNGATAPAAAGDRLWLTTLLIQLGPDVLYEVARNHAAENDLELTRSVYGELRQKLWPDLGNSRKGPRADLPEEGSGASPPRGGRKPDEHVRAFVESLGRWMTFPEAAKLAVQQGLTLAVSTYERHRKALYGSKCPSSRVGPVRVDTAATARAGKALAAGVAELAATSAFATAPLPMPAELPASALLEMARAVRAVGGLHQARCLLDQLEAIGAALVVVP